VAFFKGEYFRAIDGKSRLAIPPKLRESINPGEEGYGFVAVRLFDNVLYLYTPKTYDCLSPHFKPALEANADVRHYKRLRYALAQDLEVDGMGRVLIPENMLRRAGLTKEVVIIGVEDHIEVWDRARWEAYAEEQLAVHDQVAARAMALAQEESSPAGQKPAADAGEP
jgi:MraZ protein